MALLNILTFPDKILTQKSNPVTDIDETIVKLTEDMAETMFAAPGVGLAAPQVGLNIRLIVTIDPEDLNTDDNEETEIKTKDQSHLVLINPVITSQEGQFVFEDEGCLSVPEYRANVKRSERVTVEALNLKGESVLYTADGMFSVVLQHEIDHLDGRLFIDRISKLKREIVKKKLIKLKRNNND